MLLNGSSDNELVKNVQCLKKEDNRTHRFLTRRINQKVDMPVLDGVSRVSAGFCAHRVFTSGVTYSRAGGRLRPNGPGLSLRPTLDYLVLEQQSRIGERSVAIRVAQVVGAALPILTIAGSLSADTDWTTRIGLALMHLVVAGFVVAGLELMRRRVVAG